MQKLSRRQRAVGESRLGDGALEVGQVVHAGAQADAPRAMGRKRYVCLGFEDVHETLLERPAFRLKDHLHGERGRPHQGPAVEEHAVAFAIELQGSSNRAVHLARVAFNFDFEAGDVMEVIEVPERLASAGGAGQYGQDESRQ